MSCHEECSPRLKVMPNPDMSCFQPWAWLTMCEVHVFVRESLLHFLFIHSLKFFIFAFYRSCRCIDPATWSEPFLRVLTVELREAPCRRSQFRPWILVWFTPHSSGSSRCSPSGSWITVLRFLVQSPIISEGSVRCSATHRRTRRHFVNSSKYASMFEEFPVICVFNVKLGSWCSSARSFWVVSLITTNLNLKDRGPCLEWMRMISDRSNVFLMSRYLDIVVQF